MLLSYGVDGTQSDGACRMVNDEHVRKSNTQMKVLSVDGTPVSVPVRSVHHSKGGGASI